MPKPQDASTGKYATLVKKLMKNPEVSQSDKKGFGSTALWAHGKIFAMLSSKSEFVVKVPKPRVDSLIAAGDGRPFDTGKGRIMKEWLVVEDPSEEKWLSLAREALKFAASKR